MSTENYDTVMRLIGEDNMSPVALKAMKNLGALEKKMTEVTKANKSLLSMGPTFTKFGKNLAFFGAAIEAPILLATKAAESFEDNMFKVNRTLGKSPADLKVKKMSLETGKMPTELTTGLEAALGAGYDAAGALKITGTGAKLAVGGAIELNDSMKLLTGSMAEYHTKADQVNRVSDQFILAQKNRVNLTALAGGIKEVSGQAEAVGVKLPEVLGYLTSMQAQGETTGESMENLKNLLGMMGKVPLAKNKGMLSWLNTLGAVAKTNKKAFALMFDSPEQAESIKKTIQGIKGLQNEIKKYNIIGNDGSKTQAAFGDRSETATFHLNQMKSSTNVLAEKIGLLLTPSVIKQIDSLDSLVKVGIAFVDHSPDITKAILEIGAAFASVALIGGGAATVFGKILTMLNKFKGIVGMAGMGTGAFAGGLAASIGLGYAAKETMNDIEKNAKATGGNVPVGTFGEAPGFGPKIPGIGILNQYTEVQNAIAKETKKSKFADAKDWEIVGVLSDPMKKVVDNNKKAQNEDIASFRSYLAKKNGMAEEEFIAPLFSSDVSQSHDITTGSGWKPGQGAPVSNHFNRIEKVELHNVNSIEDLMQELFLAAENG